MADAKPRRGPLCKTCRHEKVELIDQLLAERVSARDISAQTGLSKNSINRHGRHCLSALEARAKAAKEGLRAPRRNASRPQQLRGRRQAARIVDGLELLGLPKIVTRDDFVTALEGVRIERVRLAAELSETDNYRMRDVALKGVQDAIMAIGKAHKWISDSPNIDNRQINVYTKMSDDMLEKLEEFAKVGSADALPAPADLEADTIIIGAAS